MVSGYISNFGATLENIGVMDFFLPFLLVFAIIFAVLKRIKILGDRRNINGVVALILALLFVMPHIMGTYPLGYDPVQVMNEVLPSISLVAIAAIMLLILMGIFGADFSAAAAPIIAIISVIFVVYIFGSSLNFWDGPSDTFYWWNSDVTFAVVVILIIGIILWFLMRDETKTEGGEMLKQVGRLFQKR